MRFQWHDFLLAAASPNMFGSQQQHSHYAQRLNAPGNMPRNVSAPAFMAQRNVRGPAPVSMGVPPPTRTPMPTPNATFTNLQSFNDPMLDDLLKQAAKDEGVAAPAQPSRPNYSRSAMADATTMGMPNVKTKPADSFLGDVLSSQGFCSQSKQPSAGTLAGMRRAEEVKEMTPEQVLVRQFIREQNPSRNTSMVYTDSRLDTWQRAQHSSTATVTRWCTVGGRAEQVVAG